MGVTEHLFMKAFEVGDHVWWNSEAGHVSGRIVRIHTRDTMVNAQRDIDVYLRASAFVPRTWSYLGGRVVTGMAPDVYFTRDLEIQ